jgi:hypothetical protein
MKKIILITICSLLAACGNIPTNSGIKEGSVLGTTPEGSIIRVIASKPQAGMSPDQIVSGFLNASASTDNDFAIAREYLVPNKKDNWNPSQQIKVFEGLGNIKPVGSGSVLFSAPLSAVIDSQARMAISNPDELLSAQFKLIKVDDQWRIDEGFDGLYISQSDLDRSFNTYPLWFISKSINILVPEMVILPRSITGNATRLMQLLLGGPSSNLSDAVVSSFPGGTDLAIKSVPIINGLATVTLNQVVLGADPLQRELLSAQIVKTLSKITEVTNVRIIVGGQSLIVPTVSNRQRLSDWVKYSADENLLTFAYGIQDNKLVKIDKESITSVEKDEIVSGRWFAGVSNRSENMYSLVNAERNQLSIFDYRNGQVATTTVSGKSFRIPHTDVLNTTWVTGDEKVIVVQEGQVLEVLTEEIASGNIIEVVPSPDGVRALLIVRTVYGAELRMGTIIRQPNRIKITNIRKINREGFAVSQVSWQDEEMAIYQDSSVEPVEIYSLNTISGVSVNLYSLAGVNTSASSPNKTFLVSLNNGNLLERDNGSWVNRGLVINPTYPG